MGCCCKPPPTICYKVHAQTEVLFPCCYKLVLDGIVDDLVQCERCPPGCDIQNRTYYMNYHPGTTFDQVTGRAFTSPDYITQSSCVEGSPHTCWNSRPYFRVELKDDNIATYIGTVSDRYETIEFSAVIDLTQLEDTNALLTQEIELSTNVRRIVLSDNKRICNNQGVTAKLVPSPTICSTIPACIPIIQNPDICTICYGMHRKPIRAIITFPDGYDAAIFLGRPVSGCPIIEPGDYVVEMLGCSGGWDNGEPPTIFVGGQRFWNPRHKRFTVGFSSVQLPIPINQPQRTKPVFSVLATYYDTCQDVAGNENTIWRVDLPIATVCGSDAAFCNDIPDEMIVPFVGQGACGLSCRWDGSPLRVQFERD